ncbi:MAG: C-terminal binding protein [Treponema sp.]|nr:C-terminal binding protein [Treponema sp.]
MESKIVISDCDHDSVEIEREVLAREGLGLDWRKCVSEDEVISGCADASALLVQYARMTGRVMRALPKLRQIVRYGVGFDTVDVDSARELGITVCNVPDYGMNEVADHAMALTLCLARRLAEAAARVRAGSWNYLDVAPVARISGLTVGIVGLGQIGRQYARRMEAFGPRILASDPRDIAAPDYVTMTGLDDLLRASDIISVHCPAGGNIGLIGEREFALMKQGAILVNTARGGIVDEAALDGALASGKLAGCGLDVAAREPLLKDNPLFRHQNLIVSPHMAWYSQESARELKRKVAEEASRFARGEPVRYRVV